MRSSHLTQHLSYPSNRAGFERRMPCLTRTARHVSYGGRPQRGWKAAWAGQTRRRTALSMLKVRPLKQHRCETALVSRIPRRGIETRARLGHHRWVMEVVLPARCAPTASTAYACAFQRMAPDVTMAAGSCGALCLRQSTAESGSFRRYCDHPRQSRAAGSISVRSSVGSPRPAPA